MIDEPHKGIVKRNQKHSELPLSTASLRQELLEAAGFDRDYQVELMREVVEGAREAMKAEKETPGFFMGELKDVHKQADHSARAKARDQLVDILGASGKASSTPHAKGDKPEIPLPPWMLNMTFNGQAAPSVVVESSPIVETKVDNVLPIGNVEVDNSLDNKADDISHL